MIKKIIIVVFLCMMVMGRADAEVQVNEDRTIRFSYTGPGKCVYVQSNIVFADEDSSRLSDKTRRMRMHQESDGKWYLETKAVHPETYTYCFRINGKRKQDVYNCDTAWQMTHVWNIVTIGGTKISDLCLPPVQGGILELRKWYSSTEQLWRRVNIYTPAGYEQCTDSMAVLYLLHGINGYEGSWAERGRAIQIIQNSIDRGLCKPFIVVMPDCNMGSDGEKTEHHTLFKNIVSYPRLCHDHDIEKSLVDLTIMVDSSYRVSNRRWIAGFSDGARLAANTANLLPGYFERVGIFSPVVHKDQMPQDSATYYVYVGKKDIFHGNAKRFYKRLHKQSPRHQWYETDGGHIWRNWRLFLEKFIESTE